MKVGAYLCVQIVFQEEKWLWQADGIQKTEQHKWYTNNGEESNGKGSNETNDANSNKKERGVPAMRSNQRLKDRRETQAKEKNKITENSRAEGGRQQPHGGDGKRAMDSWNRTEAAEQGKGQDAATKIQVCKECRTLAAHRRKRDQKEPEDGHHVRGTGLQSTTHDASE